MEIQAPEVGAQAEYYSASLGTVEVIYLRQLLLDMGFGPTSPTPVYEDDNVCIEWTNNVIGGRERAKHINIRKHFAHEAALLGHLRLNRVSTTDQLRRLADVFTKSLQPAQFATIFKALLVFSGRHGRDRKGRGSSRGVT